MKHARVAYAGAIHDAVEEGGRLRLADGRLPGEEDVVWLPPVEAGTIFALGLNYSDHARELSFRPPEEPLVFLKGSNTLCGHRGQTPRPAGIENMHYECELAVVIGKTARRVPRERVPEYIAGYTVANDYAIRDYLENYYRPNLRVKSRDFSTPLGPWLVDAGDVADPTNLWLRTTVNGEVRQQGSTRDMIFSIPVLIEYLSGFLTLRPGDIILTGTPEGVSGVEAGDQVVTEIEAVGRLVSNVVNRD